jgi:hypothetical protein
MTELTRRQFLAGAFVSLPVALVLMPPILEHLLKADVYGVDIETASADIYAANANGDIFILDHKTAAMGMLIVDCRGHVVGKVHEFSVQHTRYGGRITCMRGVVDPDHAEIFAAIPGRAGFSMSAKVKSKS